MCYKRQDSPGFFLFFIFFCWRASFLSSKCTSQRVFRIKGSGYLLSRRCVLKCSILSLNNVFEELVLRILRASPLIKPLFTPDGGTRKGAPVAGTRTSENSVNQPIPAKAEQDKSLGWIRNPPAEMNRFYNKVYESFYLERVGYFGDTKKSFKKAFHAEARREYENGR